MPEKKKVWSTLYEKEIEVEGLLYVVGAYDDEELGKCFRIMRVYVPRNYIEDNVFLPLKSHGEVLEAILEAMECVQNSREEVKIPKTKRLRDAMDGAYKALIEEWRNQGWDLPSRLAAFYFAKEKYEEHKAKDQGQAAS